MLEWYDLTAILKDNQLLVAVVDVQHYAPLKQRVQATRIACLEIVSSRDALE